MGHTYPDRQRPVPLSSLSQDERSLCDWLLRMAASAQRNRQAQTVPPPPPSRTPARNHEHRTRRAR
jgi:hypothetical protein